jgi:hypothetical protein
MKERGDKTMKRNFWLLMVVALATVTVARTWQARAQTTTQ